MDQRFQEQDQIASSVPAFAVTSGQMAEAISHSAGPFAGLDPMSQMSLILTSTILREGWEFETGGEVIDAARISDPECMLPMIMWEVERLHVAALSEPGGIEFLSDPSARYGVRPSVAQWDKNCASLVVMALEPLVVAMERFENRLDYLVDQFFADYARGAIPWAAASPSTVIDASRVPVLAGAAADPQVPIP